MVMEGIEEDMGDGNMICTNHPYKNNTPGGICAFCLQEKLGKLVSSSFPSAIFPSSSSSSTPSFRSDHFGVPTTSTTTTTTTTTTSSTLPSLQTNQTNNNNQTNVCNNHYGKMRKSRMPFLLSSHYNKKKKDGGNSNGSVMATMKRSKSTTTPRNGMHFLNEEEEDYNTPHRRRFWSFLYYSSSSKQQHSKKTERNMTFPSAGNGSMRSKKKEEEFVVVENENESSPAVDRKVSRSRSVGCGSRSFSGDFFERISTGFGDCTLRRVESQREGNNKSKIHHRNSGAAAAAGAGQDCIKERVRCGGLFSGFMITSSSSSSSSSSHWVSSEENMNGKSSIAPVGQQQQQQLVHGRNRSSWGWAFASPMRAFSKTSSSSNGKRGASNKNATTPNLAAIPSLLTARG